MCYEWDEQKRQQNIAKHHLDFFDADLVLVNPARVDVEICRNGETRIQSFAYVPAALTVLTIIHSTRGSNVRIISFRTASRAEREHYHEWLRQNDAWKKAGKPD